MRIRFATYDYVQELTIGGYKYSLRVWDRRWPMADNLHLVFVDASPITRPNDVVQGYIYDGRKNEWVTPDRELQDKIDSGNITDYLPSEVINTAVELAQNRGWRGGEPPLEAEASEERFYLGDSDKIQQSFDVWDWDTNEPRGIEGYGVEFNPGTLINLRNSYPGIKSLSLFAFELAEMLAVQAVQEDYIPSTPYVVHLLGSGDALRIQALFGLPEVVDLFIEKFNKFLRKHYQGWRGGEPPVEAKTAQKAIDVGEIHRTEIIHSGEQPTWVWEVKIHKNATPRLEDKSDSDFRWMIRTHAKAYQTFWGFKYHGGIANVWFKDQREAELFAGGINRYIRHGEYSWRGGEPPREAGMLLRFARHQFITLEDFSLSGDDQYLVLNQDFRDFEAFRKLDNQADIEWELRQKEVIGHSTAVTIFADAMVLRFLNSNAANLFMERFNDYIRTHTPERVRPDTIDEGDPVVDAYRTNLDELIDAWKATDDPDEKARLEAMMTIKSRSKLQGKKVRFASELELVRAWTEDDIHLYYGVSTHDWYIVMTHGIYQVYDVGQLPGYNPGDLEFSAFGNSGMFDPEETGTPDHVLQEVAALMGAQGWHGGEPPEVEDAD